MSNSSLSSRVANIFGNKLWLEMAAKRCRESCDEEQGPPLRCSRDDHSIQTQQNTTENLLRLIQTVDEMKKNKSARLLKLINEV